MIIFNNTMDNKWKLKMPNKSNHKIKNSFRTNQIKNKRKFPKIYCNSLIKLNRNIAKLENQISKLLMSMMAVI